jgi:hypothetical protein
VRGEEFQSDDAIQFDVAGLVDDTHPVRLTMGTRIAKAAFGIYT